MAEERPFLKGERVYVLWLHQPEGTACRSGAVMEDDGRDNTVLVRTDCEICYYPAEQVRRDRRGKQQPVYQERPLTPEEERTLRG